MACSLISTKVWIPTEYKKSSLPPARSGEWSISRFFYPPIPISKLKKNKTTQTKLQVYRPGLYTKLSHNSTCVMTDLYNEWWSQREPIIQAQQLGGIVLLGGLGLGLIIDSIFLKPKLSITKVLVIEKNYDVLCLVAPYLKKQYGNLVKIIHCSVFDWVIPESLRFSVTWFDIWNEPNDITLQEKSVLTDKFSKISDWMGFWDQSCFECNEFV